MTYKSIRRYKFPESKLGPNFAKDTVKKLKQLIKDNTTFSLCGMPGVGGSIFLRYLSTQHFAHFIYVDTYQLSEITRLRYYQLLARELGAKTIPNQEQEVIETCRKALNKLSQNHKRIVIILNRFDHLKSYFSDQLFADLMSLRNVRLDKISFIFTGNKPYIEVLPESISADKRNLFSKTVFLPPYNQTDTEKLVIISTNTKLRSPEFLKKAIELSGGHYQLLQLFLKSERLEPPFIDHFVKFQLKEIYDLLNYNQKKIVTKLAQKRPVDDIDEYLLGVGIVKKSSTGYSLFTQVFADFILSNKPEKMSFKELTLFRLLKSNLGQVVTKQKIFDIVWADNPTEASDWALSSLLYRLRKHPTLEKQNLVIESYKKLGLMMLKA